MVMMLTDGKYIRQCTSNLLVPPPTCGLKSVLEIKSQILWDWDWQCKNSVDFKTRPRPVSRPRARSSTKMVMVQERFLRIQGGFLYCLGCELSPMWHWIGRCNTTFKINNRHKSKFNIKHNGTKVYCLIEENFSGSIHRLDVLQRRRNWIGNEQVVQCVLG